ncbi:MAG TPA: hypothetical protein DIW28_05520 [Zetaproteobacteria bacterium]|nr:hypothetical protein [Zetaproteobacteria bacterium]
MLSEQVKQDLKNPWLRTILGTVAVVVAVNIVFITYAFISPPNLVVKDYYEQGKNYFHDKDIRQQAEASAWRLQLLLPGDMQANTPATCRLYVMDHQGQPVNSGAVRISAYRPNDANYDFSVDLQKVDTGTFAAPLSFPLPGNWDLIARIEADGQRFDTAQRIFVGK